MQELPRSFQAAKCMQSNSRVGGEVLGGSPLVQSLGGGGGRHAGDQEEQSLHGDELHLTLPCYRGSSESF